jgi:hypothetical protein
MPTRTVRDSGLVIPSVAETFDITNPSHQAAAVARVTRWGLEGTAQERTAGKQWYGMGHESVKANQGDLSFRTAAGIASALSPGSDWEKRNIPSIGESQMLNTKDYEMISRTRKEGLANLRVERAAGRTNATVPKRHADVDAMLKAKTPNLVGASDSQLLNVHAMLQGADPEDVMTRLRQPKTHAFFHGLLNPEHTQTHLAIDYKMADINANKMIGSQSYRGIGQGYYQKTPYRGRDKTNYQHHEDIIRMAGQAMHLEGGRSYAAFAHSPLKAQAYIWTLGKNYEQRHPERKMSQQNPGETHSGPVREGQPYMGPGGERL